MLTIRFVGSTGKLSTYHGVEPELSAAFNTHRSLGRPFVNKVSDRYRCVVIADEPIDNKPPPKEPVFEAAGPL